MKKSRALALLIAVGLSAGTAVQLPVATAEETPAQTMAEKYQPVYKEGDTNLAFDEAGDINQTASLPRGTEFQLRYTNWSDFYKTGPLTISVWETDGRVIVLQNDRELEAYGEEGFTANVWVAVTYPDGSMEFVEASGQFSSTTSLLTDASYPMTWIEPGTSETITPTFDGDAPTRFSFILSEELDAHREQGWEFSIDPATGVVTVTAPEEEGQQITLPVTMTFEDGSNTAFDISVRSGVEPQPEPEPTPEPEPEPDPEPIRSTGSSSSLFGSSF